MGGSLACGVAALPPVEGVAVMLADMPRVGPGHLRRLVEGFDGGIRVPVFAGRRGNPVVFGRAHFGDLAALTGESGGKALLARHPVTEVAMEDGAVLFDVDTPLDHIRARFPALGGGRHLLDNAAMAQMPDIAIEAMRIHDSSARANVRRGLHDPARDADIAFEAARAVVARFLSADPAEVVFTGGCTAALNLAAAALTDTLAPGDEVVVSLLEHHSNLLPWLAAARRKGLVVRRIPVTADGRLDAAPIGPRTRVVAVTLASNVTGAVTGLPAIAKAAHDVGAVVVADAAQLVPHGPLDAAATGADLLAFSGHKAFGPTGIGVLWGRRALLERLEPPWTGGGMVAGIDGDDFQCLPPPARFEAGTPPVTQAIGLAAALDWLMTLDWNAIAAHEAALAARLLDGLAARPEISLVGPRTARLPLVSFTAAGAHPHDIAQLLADRGIAVRAGHHCARPLADALGLAEGCVRASLALYNDAADVDALLAGLDAALEALR
jgi:cysteine desulfurase/selenocysteine lyase